MTRLVHTLKIMWDLVSIVAVGYWFVIFVIEQISQWKLR